MQAAAAGDRRGLEDSPLVEGFFHVTEAVTLICVSLLIVYPAISAIYVTVTIGHMAWLDYLDAGAHTPIATLLIRFAALMALCSWLLQPRRVPPARRLPLALAAFWVGMLLISSLLSPTHGETLPEWLNFALYVGMFAVASDVIDEPRRFMLAVGGLIASGGVVGAVSLYLYAVNPEATVLTGPFFQPNVMAGYMVMVMPLTLARIVGSDRSGVRIACFLAAVCEGGAWLLTCSRGGWASGLLVAFLLGGLAWKRVPNRRDLVGTLLAWIVFSWFLFALFGSRTLTGGHFSPIPDIAVKRAQETTDEAPSTLARLAFFRAAVQIWMEHPLWGTGLNTFNRYYTQHQTDFRWYSRYSHDLYLDLLSEGGTFAFLGFLGLVGCLGVRVRARLASGLEAPEIQVLRVGLLCGMTGSLIHSVVDVDWKFPAIPIAFFLMAALLQAPDDEPAPDPPSRWPRMGWQYGGALLCLGALLAAATMWKADLLFLEGQYLKDQGKPQQALDMATQAAAIFPWKSEYLETAADEAEHLNKLDDALRFARLSVHVDPHRAVSWYRLGHLSFRQGDLKSASEAYLQATQLDPVNFPEFYNHLAEIELANHRGEAALKIWRDILDRYPEDKIAQLQSFRRDSLNPQLVETYTNIGNYILNTTKDIPQARQNFEAALRKDPHSTSALLGMGTTYFFESSFERALEYFEDVERQDPRNFLEHLLKGGCYEHLGQPEKARLEYDKAGEIEPALKGKFAPPAPLRR